MGELINGHTRCGQSVDLICFIGIPQRHTAHKHLALACTDVRQDDAVKTIPRGLWASVQATRTRSHHDVLHEHAVIQQRAAAHDGVNGEHQTHRRIKELEVTLLLFVHAVFVTLADAQQTVEAPAVFTATVDEGADPFSG